MASTATLPQPQRQQQQYQQQQQQQQQQQHGQLPSPSPTATTLPATQLKSYNLWVHDDRFSRHELVVNPDVFPHLRPGTLVELYHPGVAANAPAGPLRQLLRDKWSPIIDGDPPDDTLVLQTTLADASTGKAQLQVSVAGHIAQLFALQARTDVHVRVQVNPAEVAADYIELAIRDQYMSRADMWRIKQAMVGHCLHVGKKMAFPGGLRVHVREIVRGSRKAACGVVTDDTKTIFRSESARVYLLVHLAAEMWQFADDADGCGDVYFERAVRDFLPDLFARWRALNVNHLVSIVFFARILDSDGASTSAGISSSSDIGDASAPTSGAATPLVPPRDLPGGGGGGTGNGSSNYHSYTQSLPTSHPWMLEGQSYRDVYKVIIDGEGRPDWSSVLPLLKAEFEQFTSTALRVVEGGVPVMRGRLAPAHQGNLLEAVNLALNPHDKHYIDRKLDFVRTGLSIQVITPGTGFLETDKRLLRLTTQRMLDNGVALDMICLARPPLHASPMFLIKSKFAASELPTQSAAGQTMAYMSGPGGHLSGVAAGPPGSSQHHSQQQQQGGAPLHLLATLGGGGGAAVADEPRTSRAAISRDCQAESWDPLYYDDVRETNPEYLFFTVPDWIDVSYIYQASSTGFNPRGRMPELMQNAPTAVPCDPAVPYLREGELASYDDHLFDWPAEQRPQTSISGGHAPGGGGGSGVSSSTASSPDAVSRSLPVRSSALANLASQLSMYDTRFGLDAAMHSPMPPSTLMNPSQPLSTALVDVDEAQAAAVAASAQLSSSYTMSSSPSHLRSMMMASMMSPSIPRTHSEGSIAIQPAHATPTAPGMMAGSTHMYVPRATAGGSGGGGKSTVAPLLSTSPAASYMMRAATAHSYRRTYEAAMAAAAASASGNGSVHDGGMAASRRTNDSAPIRSVLGPVHESYESSGTIGRVSGSGVAATSIAAPTPHGGGSSPMDMDRSHHSMHGGGSVSTLHDGSPRRSTGALAGSQLARMAAAAPNTALAINTAPSASASVMGSGWHAGPLSHSPSLQGGLHSSHGHPTGSPPRPPSFHGERGGAAGLGGPASGGAATGAGSGHLHLASYLSLQLRPNLISPWHPKRNLTKQLSHLQRWHHVYPQVASYRVAAPFWNSLCTPACLPITTDSFPTVEELLENYKQYTYPIFPNDGSADAGSSAMGVARAMSSFSLAPMSSVRNLLAEMIALRLSQGFQIVVTAPGAVHGGAASGSCDTFMSMGHHLHRLAVVSEDQVEVRRYVRRLDYVMKPVSYHMSLWSRDDQTYVARQTKFEYPQLSTFNWNFVDHAIADGDEDNEGDAHYMYRARFIFIPMDHVPTSINPVSHDQLDDEELRIAGFQRLLETIQKHVTDNTPLRVQLTSLTRSAHVRSEVALALSAAMATASSSNTGGQAVPPPPAHTGSPSGGGFSALAASIRRGSSVGLLPVPVPPPALPQIDSPSSLSISSITAATTPTTTNHTSSPLTGQQQQQQQQQLQPQQRLARDCNPITLALAMQHPVTGVSFSDRRWHLRLYERVFVGNEAVDWMTRNIQGISTREEAVALGNQLLQEGIFLHALNRHSFMDGHYFYRLRADLYTAKQELAQGGGAASSAASFASTGTTGSTVAAQGGAGPVGVPATSATLTGATSWFRSRHSTNDQDGGSVRTQNAHAEAAAAVASSVATTNASTAPGPGYALMSALVARGLVPQSSSGLAGLGAPPSNSMAGAAAAAGQGGGSSNAAIVVEMSRRVPINLDLSQKSDRKQLAVLHVDAVHNAQHVFSVQLHWLNCTTWRIAETLSHWARIGDKSGLRLVQAPLDQVKLLRERDDANAFQTPTVLRVAGLPPRDPPPPAGAPLYYEVALIRQFGFVLDVEADDKFPPGATSYSYDPRRPVKYSQYVHRSGCAFVLVRPAADGLLWVPNPLFLTTTVPTALASRGAAATAAAAASLAASISLTSPSPITATTMVPPALSPKECDRTAMGNADQLRVSMLHYFRDATGLAAFWSDVAAQLWSSRVPRGLAEELDHAPASALQMVPVGGNTGGLSTSSSSAAATPAAALAAAALASGSMFCGSNELAATVLSSNPPSAASSAAPSPIVSRRNSMAAVAGRSDAVPMPIAGVMEQPTTPPPLPMSLIVGDASLVSTPRPTAHGDGGAVLVDTPRSTSSHQSARPAVSSLSSVAALTSPSMFSSSTAVTQQHQQHQQQQQQAPATPVQAHDPMVFDFSTPGARHLHQH
ncbi:hypothetical protein BC828DRAFT_185659 [Blastocladiella britannica]|nr:hypothetical protein BC828DRAFT_185659 [Blastocladiella britannica]